MSKNEIALQLTLKVLENFEYNANDFQGESRLEQAEKNAELVLVVYNKIFSELKEQETGSNF